MALSPQQIGVSILTNDGELPEDDAPHRQRAIPSRQIGGSVSTLVELARETCKDSCEDSVWEPQCSLCLDTESDGWIVFAPCFHISICKSCMFGENPKGILQHLACTGSQCTPELTSEMESGKIGDDLAVAKWTPRGKLFVGLCQERVLRLEECFLCKKRPRHLFFVESLHLLKHALVEFWEERESALGGVRSSAVISRDFVPSTPVQACHTAASTKLSEIIASPDEMPAGFWTRDDSLKTKDASCFLPSALSRQSDRCSQRNVSHIVDTSRNGRKCSMSQAARTASPQACRGALQTHTHAFLKHVLERLLFEPCFDCDVHANMDIQEYERQIWLLHGLVWKKLLESAEFAIEARPHSRSISEKMKGMLAYIGSVYTLSADCNLDFNKLQSELDNSVLGQVWYQLLLCEVRGEHSPALWEPLAHTLVSEWCGLIPLRFAVSWNAKNRSSRSSPALALDKHEIQELVLLWYSTTQDVGSGWGGKRRFLARERRHKAKCEHLDLPLLLARDDVVSDLVLSIQCRSASAMLVRQINRLAENTCCQIVGGTIGSILGLSLIFASVWSSLVPHG
eukprot:TRINITY_DN54895_c0_g1_i1.p1 TRINITY_DN54895_c0_g1~~TRINITY_DN54895_c0_g1_i1.p1  ORF type:complete len:576 (+),score=44.72 TRINITY_DN54895_c0_g1_i1:23-1729(+)